MHILVAEDEPLLRDMLQLDLQEQGATVTVTRDGEEAIAAMEREAPHLLLLDLIMPRKDGFAVLQYIRDKGYDFPVIVLSNLSDPTQERRCKELGARDFLVKSNLGTGELWEHLKKL